MLLFQSQRFQDELVIACLRNKGKAVALVAVRSGGKGGQRKRDRNGERERKGD